MKIRKLIDVIEKIAPLHAAESWDNSGLLVGSLDCDIQKVLLCLDITEDVIKEAIDQKAGLIISHHPLIFGGVSAISDNNSTGRKLLTLIKNNINVYCAHTNLDVAAGGLNDFAAFRLGLGNIRKDSIIEKMTLGELNTPLKVGEFIEHVKKVFNVENVRTVKIPAKADKLISKVSVSTGAFYEELMPALIHEKPDALLTGDIKYHAAWMLFDAGILSIDAGHFGTEKIVTKLLAGMLKNLPVELHLSRCERDPISVI